MSTGTGPNLARRRAGRFRFALIMLLIFFGGGFYTGIQTTKRVFSSDNGILRRVFGLQPISAPAAPPVAALAAPAAPVQAATQPQAPANQPVGVTTTAKEIGAPAQSKPENVSTQPPSVADGAQSPANQGDAAAQPMTADQKLLAGEVDDYNDMLTRIQKALVSYSTVHQKSLEPKTRAQDLKLLLDQENGLLGEITTAAKHAQNVQVAVQANSDYAAHYTEGDACAQRKNVPNNLLDLDLDKLKFIERTP